VKLAITDRCTGHGRCYTLAPELITADEYGEGQVLDDGVVQAALEDDAQAAVHGCPERAVELR
jgi:ferredoxin